jgi:hypothetical protein
MEHLCFSRNDIEVVFNSKTSHVATHFADSPLLKATVMEAIKDTDIQSDEMFFEYDSNRIIGTTDLVTTTEADNIIFAKRVNRDIYTRFTKSQSPQECSTVTISLKKFSDMKYELWSAWIGYIGPSFPGDANETANSKPYWSKHALVWGNQEIQEGTETLEQPW